MTTNNTVDKPKEETIINEPFYYPYTGKWYQFIDTRIDGKLSCRVCKELKEEQSCKS